MKIRYFWKNTEVYAFDETQNDLITDDMVELTSDELDRHLNPLKYLSDEEHEAHRLAIMPTLSRRQFKLMLHNSSLLKQVEEVVAVTDDEVLRIEYQDSNQFHRDNPSILKMIGMLSLDLATVDKLWVQASNI